MLFSRNFERFSETIHFGRLDSILIKPIDSQFLLSFWLVDYPSLIRFFLSAPLLYYFIVQNHVSVTAVSFLSFVLLLCLSVVLLYSIWFLVITLTIWFTRLSNLVEILFYVTGFARFPKEMFAHLKNVLYYLVLPLSLLVTVPTKTLLQKVTVSDFVMLAILAFGLFFLSRKFWQFALRYYGSASG
jgi:ABC-2 type transport system permease protein